MTRIFFLLLFASNVGDAIVLSPGCASFDKFQRFLTWGKSLPGASFVEIILMFLPEFQIPTSSNMVVDIEAQEIKHLKYDTDPRRKASSCLHRTSSKGKLLIMLLFTTPSLILTRNAV